MLANNVFEVCNRTIRPQIKEFEYGSCFTRSPMEKDFMGVMGSAEFEMFIVALDDYDKEELSNKLVTPLKEGEVIFRLYGERIGYCGFAIFNFSKGKVRYFDSDHYTETDEYKFERYWSKPRWIRIKADEVAANSF